MKRNTSVVCLTSILLVLAISYGYSWDYSQPLLIDHTLTDLSVIPPERVDLVKLNRKFHYAHTSHGGQVIWGLNFVHSEYPDFDAVWGLGYLPTEAGKLCIFDGQEGDTYITPDEYWETTEGLDKTRSVLNNNPTINASMWCWCTQLDYYTEAQVQAYLEAISMLEAEYPGVVFVYMTGNAQATGSLGYNRYLRNEQIRGYCWDNSKVLYDFADLDSWWFNPATSEWEHATYEYEGHIVPVEHPNFNGDEYAHTTAESCLQKGKAFWWLVSLIEGGAGDSVAVHDPSWGEVKELFR